MNLKTQMYFDELSPYIRHAGIQNLDNTFRSSRKIYDHEFLIGVKGISEIEIQDKKYIIKKNNIILLKPNREHIFNWTKGDGFFYWVHFDFKYQNDSVNITYLQEDFHDTLFKKTLPWSSLIRKEPVFENGFTFPEFLQIEDSTLIIDYMDKLIKTYEKQNLFWQLECRTYMFFILRLILEECYREKSFINLTNSKQNISNTIIEYVTMNLRRKLTLKVLANTFGYNEEYLGKVFIKETGEKYTDFLNKARIMKASSLILTSQLSIGNVAEICGFYDLFHFSKTFKKYTGFSPSTFRKSTKHN